MEQHPIPQNITGFEFKLIGDMTIKQFAYLAGCAVLAYLVFASPLHPLIKFPFVIFFALFGIALAFVPVGGRPLDRWITNFIRALFAPSQYIFHKQSGLPEFLQLQTSSTRATPATTGATGSYFAKRSHFSNYLQTLTPATLTPDTSDQERLAAINQAFSDQKTQPLPTPQPKTQPQDMPILSGYQVGNIPTAQVIPTPSPVDTNRERQYEDESGIKFEQENRKLREEIENMKKHVETLKQPQTTSQPTQQVGPQQAFAIEQKLQEALSEKERLTAQLAKLQTVPKAPVNTVTPTQQPAPKPSENVRIVAATQAAVTGVAGFPQAPNLVAGIIKDKNGDILPNIIIEVKDSNGNPVRAFKTNKLGQFSAATALSSGKYTIELEDPRGTYTFDIVAIELTGDFFQPIEILPKNQIAPERQQLYSALFGNKQQQVSR